MVYYYILLLFLICYVSVNDEFVLVGDQGRNNLSAENGMFTVFMISKDFVYQKYCLC